MIIRCSFPPIGRDIAKAVTYERSTSPTDGLRETVSSKKSTVSNSFQLPIVSLTNKGVIENPLSSKHSNPVVPGIVTTYSLRIIWSKIYENSPASLVGVATIKSGWKCSLFFTNRPGINRTPKGSTNGFINS